MRSRRPLPAAARGSAPVRAAAARARAAPSLYNKSERRPRTVRHRRSRPAPPPAGPAPAPPRPPPSPSDTLSARRGAVALTCGGRVRVAGGGPRAAGVTRGRAAAGGTRARRGRRPGPSCRCAAGAESRRCSPRLLPEARGVLGPRGAAPFCPWGEAILAPERSPGTGSSL